MKIGVVCFTGNSGLTDYSVSLCRSLSPNHQATLFTSSSISPNFTQFGFSVNKVFRRSRHYFIDIFKFIREVIRSDFDWVVFQGPLKFTLFDLLVVRVLRFLGVKVVITVHDVLPHYPKPWSRFTFSSYYRSFDKVIAHSESAKILITNMGVKNEILVVPHGVYDIFNISNISKTDARSKLGIDNNKFVVLFFGHLESRKGLYKTIDAAFKCIDKNRTLFLFAGAFNATDDKEMVAEFENAKNYPNVLIHDNRIPFEYVENYFSACDVVILPYLEGTTSGVLKLALAFRKPVIATPIGDFPEQIPEGAGLFIENDSDLPTSINSAVIWLDENYDKYFSAMNQAAINAEWSDISTKIVKFLSSN